MSVDYEKILKSLKICSDTWTSCEGCSGRGERHCIANLTKAAAIAIETMLHTLDMAQRERDVVTKHMIELEQETVTKCNDLFDEDGGDIYPEKDSICASTNLPCCRCNPGPCEHRNDVPDTNAGKNTPLTLDELRQMNGEPVWTVTIGISGSGRWELCTCETVCACPLHKVLRCVTADGLVTDYDFGTYGKTWLAYRHKPEEGTV